MPTELQRGAVCQLSCEEVVMELSRRSIPTGILRRRRLTGRKVMVDFDPSQMLTSAA
jgi:hypothetical protein